MRKRSLTGFQLISLAVFLILPGLALYRVAGGDAGTLRWSGVLLIAISLATYHVFAFDKQLALESGRRISEKSLHVLETLGGWPGSYLAQNRFRHKIAKGSYQLTFRAIIVAYQGVAWLVIEMT